MDQKGWGDRKQGELLLWAPTRELGQPPETLNVEPYGATINDLIAYMYVELHVFCPHCCAVAAQRTLLGSWVGS